MTITKSFIILMGWAILSGCVSVEMPETMLSDAAKATRETYDAITEEFADDDKDQAKGIFVYKFVGDETMSLRDVKQECMARARQKAAKQMNTDDKQISLIAEQVEVADNSLIARCKIKLTPTP